MSQLSFDGKTGTLLLSRRAWLCVNNALNEVCHGFRVTNFSMRIGVSREEAARLLDTVHAEGQRVWGEEVWSDSSLAVGSARIKLALDEMLGIRNAISETLRELGVEEFETRVGVPFEDGQVILAKLDEFLRAMDDTT